MASQDSPESGSFEHVGNHPDNGQQDGDPTTAEIHMSEEDIPDDIPENVPPTYGAGLLPASSFEAAASSFGPAPPRPRPRSHDAHTSQDNMALTEMIRRQGELLQALSRQQEQIMKENRLLKEKHEHCRLSQQQARLLSLKQEELDELLSVVQKEQRDRTERENGENTSTTPTRPFESKGGDFSAKDQSYA